MINVEVVEQRAANVGAAEQPSVGVGSQEIIRGVDGATFTPSVSEEGIISWTNDAGLPNPTERDITGPQGGPGPQGAPGPKGDPRTWADLEGKPPTFPPSSHNHDERYYTESEVDDKLADKANVLHNHDDRYYTESEVDNKLVDKADVVHNHDDRYYTEAEVDTLLDNKADSSHDHDDRYYTETEANNKFVTLNTQQTITAKKSIRYTEPISYGGQETALKVLSTHKTADMNNSMWAGRMMVGTEDKTFLMGVYKYQSGGICGLGAHSWTKASEQTGPAWENVYIQPDGDKALYLGGYMWTPNSGWLRIQNNNNGVAGSNHVHINVGTNTAPSWKVVPFINDDSTADNATWSAQKLNSMIGDIEATLQTIRGV